MSLKAFLNGQDVFTLFLTDFGESLMFQLASAGRAQLLLI